jgi:hypothetical protein
VSTTWVQNVAVGLTILSLGVLVNTSDNKARRSIKWLAGRAALAMVALVSLFVAAQKFGPDGSKVALAIAFSTLWLPQLLLAFQTQPRWAASAES